MANAYGRVGREELITMLEAVERERDDARRERDEARGETARWVTRMKMLEDRIGDAVCTLQGRTRRTDGA